MSALFHQAARAWWTWTAPMSAQVAVLAAVVLAVELTLGRRARPALRAALWGIVLLKLVLPPSIASPVSVAQLAPRPESGPSLATRSSSLLPSACFAVWLAGLALGACGCALRYVHLRARCRSGARPAPARIRRAADDVARRLGLARTPRILVCPSGSGPAVLGFLRPVICLPQAFLDGCDAEQLRCVLAHELAHVRRRDPLASLAVLALQLAYWFHPLVWLAARRASTLREIRCDERALRALESKAAYRRTLLEMARPLLERPALGRQCFVPPRARILVRLEWLGRPGPRRPALERAASALVCGLVLACCVPLARSSADAAARAFQAPPLDELEGCLQRRYVVLGLLAEQQRATAAATRPD